MVVSVTQYYETIVDEKKKRTLYAIGFAVYEITSSMTRLTPQFVAHTVGEKQLHLFGNRHVHQPRDEKKPVSSRLENI